VRKLLVAACLVSLVASVFCLGCRGAKHERVSVAVSMFPLSDLVQRIAGPDADVTVVLPSGTALEGWSPPTEVRAQVRNATLLVAVGLGIDPWMDGLLSAAAPKARILRLGDRVPTIVSEDRPINGYVWMDPQRARLMATAIGEDLARADPSHAGAFRDRASVLDASLAALDKEIEARTSALSGREIPLPEAMAYYAERYGLSAVHPSTAVGKSVFDSLGSAGNNRSYEDLIRSATAAVEGSLR
jgi:zinc transport system substrate-binding protein